MWMDAAIENIGKAAEDSTKRLILDLGGTILAKAPVLTGLFRGNWQLGLGTNPSVAITRLDPNGTDAYDAMASEFRGAWWKTSVGYITNNVPYAYALEFGPGQSRKAPNGVARISVVEIAAKYPV